MSTRYVRQQLYNDQFGFCAYCFNKMTMAPNRGNTCTREHVLPRSSGGSNAFSNLVGACADCNNEKGSKPLWKFLLDRKNRINSPRP